MDRFEQLTARYLDDLLSPEESSDLARMVERDGLKARRLAEIYSFHRRLEEFHRAPAPEALEAIMAEIARGETEFVRSVFTRVQAERPEEPTNPTSQLQEIVRRWWGRAAIRYGFALAVGVTLVVGAAFWLFGPVVGEARLADVQGTGLLLDRGDGAFRATNGTPLKAGDLLSTRANTRAAISFAPEKTRIALHSNTAIKIFSLSYGKRFSLREGAIEATVAHQSPFHAMVLTTPQAEAQVVGTKFTLTATTNASRLEVAEGKVRFSRLGEPKAVIVASGHYAVAAENYELRPQPLTGAILREYWTNVPGRYFMNYLLSNPRFPDHPSSWTNLANFEAPPNQGEDYGARFRGYLHPPVTGVYTFWIAANQGAELYLSPSEDPAGRRQIAYADETGPREWGSRLGQQSPSLALVAGRTYYIEALQKHGKGTNGVDEAEGHLSVAWQGPGRARELLPGKFLSPCEPREEGQ